MGLTPIDRVIPLVGTGRRAALRAEGHGTTGSSRPNRSPRR
jgi:hypothetical protein